MKLSRDFTLNAPVKSVEDVVTVCDYVANDAKKIGAGQGFVLSGGSITKTLHGKSEADFYVPYIEAIKNIGTNPRITFEVNARPRDEVKRYKDAGADIIHFNMEVWDKKLFPWINPGKAERVGWDNWVRWMEDAVEVFGTGRSNRVSSQASKWPGRTASRPWRKRSPPPPIASNISCRERSCRGRNSGAASRRRRCARKPSSRRCRWITTFK